MGTHRNKIRACKVPNDSCGCADAHVADDREKPPVRKQSRERTELRVFHPVRQMLQKRHPVGSTGNSVSQSCQEGWEKHHLPEGYHGKDMNSKSRRA